MPLSVHNISQGIHGTLVGAEFANTGAFYGSDKDGALAPIWKFISWITGIKTETYAKKKGDLEAAAVDIAKAFLQTSESAIHARNQFKVGERIFDIVLHDDGSGKVTLQAGRESLTLRAPLKSIKREMLKIYIDANYDEINDGEMSLAGFDLEGVDTDGLGVSPELLETAKGLTKNSVERGDSAPSLDPKDVEAAVTLAKQERRGPFERMLTSATTDLRESAILNLRAIVEQHQKFDTAKVAGDEGAMKKARNAALGHLASLEKVLGADLRKLVIVSSWLPLSFKFQFTNKVSDEFTFELPKEKLAGDWANHMEKAYTFTDLDHNIRAQHKYMAFESGLIKPPLLKHLTKVAETSGNNRRLALIRLKDFLAERCWISMFGVISDDMSDSDVVNYLKTFVNVGTVTHRNDEIQADYLNLFISSSDLQKPVTDLIAVGVKGYLNRWDKFENVTQPLVKAANYPERRYAELEHFADQNGLSRSLLKTAQPGIVTDIEFMVYCENAASKLQDKMRGSK